MLHTCNKSSPALLDTVLPLLTAGDALLLIEDGVYAAVAAAAGQTGLDTLPAEVKLYVLEEDLAARGISGIIRPAFSRVDLAGFVALTLSHARVLNWS